MTTLARGMTEFFLAVPYLLARGKLLRLVLAPFLIALVIAALLLWWVSTNVDPMVHSAMSHVPDLLTSVAGTALRTLLWVALMGLAYVAFLALVSVLTTPFCEMISEAIEEEHTGTPAPPFSVSILLRDLALGLAHAVRRLGLLIASLLALFLLSAIIPVVGAILALALGAWFTSRFAAYDCFDTIWARKGTGYPEKMTYLKNQRAYTTGLGLAVAGAALVPVVNALAFPLGTIAATRHYLATDQRHPS